MVKASDKRTLCVVAAAVHMALVALVAMLRPSMDILLLCVVVIGGWGVKWLRATPPR